MLLQQLTSLVHHVSGTTGMGLSVFMVIGSSSASALTPSLGNSIQISQYTPRDVVVDTRQSQGSTSTTSTTTGDPRFTCEIVNGQYTVMYRPESQPGQAYPWATPRQMGGGWSPERRCYAISQRLESYRPDGLLALRTSVKNGYSTVCATTQAVRSCRIVFTVPPGQDPELTRDRVFQNLTVANSGQQTQAVNTFVDRDQGIVQQLGQLFNGSRNTSQSDGINLRPFLTRDDGGTATQLRSGESEPSTNSGLNPEDFR